MNQHHKEHWWNIGMNVFRNENNYILEKLEDFTQVFFNIFINKCNKNKKIMSNINMYVIIKHIEMTFWRNKRWKIRKKREYLI